MTSRRACGSRGKFGYSPGRANGAWRRQRRVFKYKLAGSTLAVVELAPARYRAPDLGFRCVKDP